MLQCVAAVGSGRGEDGPVGGFKDLRNTIDRKRNDEVEATRVSRRKQREQNENWKERTELYERVRPQVSVTIELCDAPVEHGRNSHKHERGEENDAGFH